MKRLNTRKSVKEVREVEQIEAEVIAEIEARASAKEAAKVDAGVKSTGRPAQVVAATAVDDHYVITNMSNTIHWI